MSFCHGTGRRISSVVNWRHDRRNDHPPENSRKPTSGNLIESNRGLHRTLTAKLRSGPIFRAIDRHGNLRQEGIDGSSVNRILKSMAVEAGLPEEVSANLSGHSMRVGRAQDLMLEGFDLLPIMRAGGWKSFSIVGRYVENVEIGKLLKSRGLWE